MIWPFGKWIEKSRQPSTASYIHGKTGVIFKADVVVVVEKNTRTGRERAYVIDLDNKRSAIQMDFVE